MAVLIWLGYSPIRSGLHLELLHSLASSGDNKTIAGRIVRHILLSPFFQFGFLPENIFCTKQRYMRKKKMQFFLVLVCYKEAGENTVTSKTYCIFAASFWYIWSKDSGYKGDSGYGASSAPPEVLPLQIL